MANKYAIIICHEYTHSKGITNLYKSNTLIKSKMGLEISDKDIDLILSEPPKPPEEMEEKPVKFTHVIKKTVGRIKLKAVSKKQERPKKEMHEYKAKVKDLKKQKDSFEKELKKLKKVPIAKKIKLLSEKENALIEKEKELIEKEAEVMKGIKQLSRESYQWNKMKSKLEKDVKKLESRKDTTIDKISAKNVELLNLKKEIKEKEKTLEDDKRELGKKEDEIMERLNEIEKSRKELESKEDDIQGIIKEMEKNKKILLKEEKKVTGKLSKLKKEHDKIKENSAFVIESNKRLDYQLKERKLQLSKLNKEWEIKQRVFNDNLEFLRKRKQELTPLLKEVSNDINKLNKKETDILKDVEKLEKNRNLLNEKEKEFIDKIKRLENVESSVKKREKEVSRKEAIIANAKELKDNIPKLKREFTKAKQLYENEQGKLNDLIAEATAKKGLIKNKEIELMRKDDYLAKREKWIKDREYELSVEKQQIGREEVHLMGKEPLKKDIDFTKIKEGEEYPIHPEVRPLIRKARELIINKSTDEAFKTIQEIEAIYNGLKATDSEKRKINYDLLELKTEVKLAELSKIA